mgnify:CR=1 FL=1
MLDKQVFGDVRDFPVELLEGVEYRVSNQYFLPDGQGNPRRIVRLYRAAGFVAVGEAEALRPGSALRSQAMRLALSAPAA